MIEKNISGAQLISHDKRGGRKYWVPETDKFFIKVLSNNSFQYENVRRLISLCPKPRHIVDIGTNLAQNVIEYATFCSKVTGFEPTPFIFECAVANVEENRHLYPNAEITIHPVALGEKSGTIALAMHTNNVGKNYLISDTGTRKNTVSVDIKTLDSYNLENVDLIKIDVEGYELYVLRGSENTIMRDRPFIQTEILIEHCTRAGYTPQYLQNWFNERDYVRTLKNGNVISGKEYQHFTGDSFWVPREKITIFE
jgi:hypothetical protein